MRILNLKKNKEFAVNFLIKQILNITSIKYGKLSQYNQQNATNKYNFFKRLHASRIVQKANHHWKKIDVPVLEKLRNIHINKDRCFIIGNGPSLNSLDLSKLKNEITFGANAIFLNFERMDFKPTYYVVEDNLVAEDRAEEINNLKGMIKFFPLRLAYCIKRDNETILMNHCSDDCAKIKYPFSKDISKFTCGGNTVTYTMLQIAYYMGFKKVYLIGVDHNYQIPDHYKKFQEDENYIIQPTEDDKNHFDKNYFGKGYRWHNPTVHLMEMSYEIAKLCYYEDGRCIYNATKGGKLEVFERVGYNDLFNIC